MVSSSAETIEEYLADLAEPRKTEVATLLELVRKSIPKGFVETMDWGMICFQVPLEVSGPTYNNKPLVSVAIASQKIYISIYLLGIYASEELTAEFHERWKKSGKKLDMGKSCVRFRKLEEADPKTISWAVGLLNPREFTAMYLATKAK